MALTKVQKTGITDNAIDADKIEDGTVLDADIANGTITADKLASTLDLSSKTVTLPNTSVSNVMLAGSITNDKLANSSITVNGNSVSLGGSVSAGKVQWQSVITADGSTTTASAGEGYFIDTTSNAHTITLPGSPSIGDTIAIKDYAGTFGTNALTIGRNGNNIQGVANDSEIGTNRASVVLVYIDGTKGWLYTNESNVADLQVQPEYVAATGGTITTSTDYKIHTFTGDGCFVVSQAGNPIGSNSVDYLVVAGGGGGGGTQLGGNNRAGGGGAGGYRESSGTASGCYTVSPLGACVAALPVSVQTYPITVGGGGSGTFCGRTGGSNSVFSTITSAGGGFGSQCSPAANQAATTGGSGGGGAARGTLAAGNTPPVSPPQGNDGGAGTGFNGIGGGGGGALTVGGDGPGGNGATSSINTTPTTRGGGGGGSLTGTGGSGGGGSARGGSGSVNTGGGGAGNYPAASVPGPNTPSAGGAGGSGIVIIRYKFQ